jgi:hypothetical protein
MLIADDDIISRKLILKSVHEFAKEIIKKQGVKQLKNSKRTQMLI